MKKLFPSLPRFPLFRSPCALLVSFGVAGLLSGDPTASAQSAASWLSTASVPNRAALFGPVSATTKLSDSNLSGAATAGLPEAPVPQFASEPKPKRGTDPSEHIAQRRTKVIPSNWKGQPLTAGDKVRLGATDLYSFDNFAAMILSAGYEHVLNSSPNYGTDKGAFGERLGAAAIRETTQGAFTDIVFSPLLHEDPRYYVKGPKFNPAKRTVYAVTRTLITRRDNGGSSVNGSLLLGYAASAALTPAYYPSINRNFKDVASVYGGSLGGAAVGFFVTEFSEDIFRALHLNRAP